MAFEKKLCENSRQMNFDHVGSIFVPKTISNILQEVSMIHDISKKSSKLDFHVHSLEEEMGKIDAFKRELPHCMHLLKDAIEILKKERLQWKGREMGPVMEEFIPLKSNSEGDGRAKRSNDFTDKKNWMSSVQLWSTPVQYENNFDSTRNQDSVLSLRSRYQEDGFERQQNKHDGCNLGNRGGAFSPFKRLSSSSDVTTRDEDKRGPPVNDNNNGLSLSVPVESNGCGFVRPKLQQHQLQRKQRRCWSPELHKRFVDALQHLGGPQMATPKQIRELMKVEGLTNDEVKSHLQKYRLHVRKIPSSSSGATDYPWLTQDRQQFEGLQKQMVGNSGSPQDHLHKAKGGSTTVNGDSMEEDDDDIKSETHSWKGRRPTCVGG